MKRKEESKQKKEVCVDKEGKCKTSKNLKFSKSIKLNNKLLKWLRKA